ncbi:Cysteine proteinases superfamily protein [Prunus dulcis]|uniref:Cysteine proteinases superfamily protein n=1 Tax=Prunus dulcis TaxID=3755 RepID=A0A4Y1RIH2_PRUDU|nr:Cysteine proteinases superfamily protein [Prunus dulcis]
MDIHQINGPYSRKSELHQISPTLRIPTLSPSTLHKKKKKKERELFPSSVLVVSNVKEKAKQKQRTRYHRPRPRLFRPRLSNFRYEVSKHRSCWRHVFAYLIVQKKKLALKDIELIKKRYPCLLEFPCRFHRGERLKRKGKREEMKELRPPKDAKNAVSRKKEKLDSQAFECKEKLGSEAFDRYFQNLWKNLSEDKRTSFAGHWNLLIFCHFGESDQSETHKPCMLLLDSLENADPRRFVLDIYKAEGRSETKDFIYQIPFLVPKVPQQRNDVECGNFVLYYINLFIEGAPENFSIEGGYPYFAWSVSASNYIPLQSDVHILNSERKSIDLNPTTGHGRL